jgi:hypothetical protein
MLISALADEIVRERSTRRVEAVGASAAPTKSETLDSTPRTEKA